MASFIKREAGMILVGVKVSHLRHLGLFLAAIIGIVALNRFARFVEKRGTPHEIPPLGISVRQELVAVCAPRALIGFLKEHDPTTIPEKELMRLLKEAGLLKMWYGTTFLSYQADGRVQTLPGYTRLSDIESKFSEMIPILQTLAARAPAYPTVEYSRARIITIPEELIDQEPGEVMRKLPMQPKD